MILASRNDHIVSEIGINTAAKHITCFAAVIYFPKALF